MPNRTISNQDFITRFPAAPSFEDRTPFFNYAGTPTKILVAEEHLHTFTRDTGVGLYNPEELQGLTPQQLLILDEYSRQGLMDQPAAMLADCASKKLEEREIVLTPIRAMGDTIKIVKKEGKTYLHAQCSFLAIDESNPEPKITRIPGKVITCYELNGDGKIEFVDISASNFLLADWLCNNATPPSPENIKEAAIEEISNLYKNYSLNAKDKLVQLNALIETLAAERQEAYRAFKEKFKADTDEELFEKSSLYAMHLFNSPEPFVANPMESALQQLTELDFSDKAKLEAFDILLTKTGEYLQQLSELRSGNDVGADDLMPITTAWIELASVKNPVKLKQKLVGLTTAPSSMNEKHSYYRRNLSTCSLLRTDMLTILSSITQTPRNTLTEQDKIEQLRSLIIYFQDAQTANPGTTLQQLISNELSQNSSYPTADLLSKTTEILTAVGSRFKPEEQAALKMFDTIIWQTATFDIHGEALKKLAKPGDDMTLALLSYCQLWLQAKTTHPNYLVLTQELASTLSQPDRTRRLEVFAKILGNRLGLSQPEQDLAAEILKHTLKSTEKNIRTTAWHTLSSIVGKDFDLDLLKTLRIQIQNKLNLLHVLIEKKLAGQPLQWSMYQALESSYAKETQKVKFEKLTECARILLATPAPTTTTEMDADNIAERTHIVKSHLLCVSAPTTMDDLLSIIAQWETQSLTPYEIAINLAPVLPEFAGAKTWCELIDTYFSTDNEKLNQYTYNFLKNMVEHAQWPLAWAHPEVLPLLNKKLLNTLMKEAESAILIESENSEARSNTAITVSLEEQQLQDFPASEKISWLLKHRGMHKDAMNQNSHAKLAEFNQSCSPELRTFFKYSKTLETGTTLEEQRALHQQYAEDPDVKKLRASLAPTATAKIREIFTPAPAIVATAVAVPEIDTEETPPPAIAAIATPTVTTSLAHIKSAVQRAALEYSNIHKKNWRSSRGNSLKNLPTGNFSAANVLAYLMGQSGKRYCDESLRVILLKALTHKPSADYTSIEKFNAGVLGWINQTLNSSSNEAVQKLIENEFKCTVQCFGEGALDKNNSAPIIWAVERWNLIASIQNPSDTKETKRYESALKSHWEPKEPKVVRSCFAFSCFTKATTSEPPALTH